MVVTSARLVARDTGALVLAEGRAGIDGATAGATFEGALGDREIEGVARAAVLCASPASIASGGATDRIAALAEAAVAVDGFAARFSSATAAAGEVVALDEPAREAPDRIACGEATEAIAACALPELAASLAMLAWVGTARTIVIERAATGNRRRW